MGLMMLSKVQNVIHFSIKNVLMGNIMIMVNVNPATKIVSEVAGGFKTQLVPMDANLLKNMKISIKQPLLAPRSQQLACYLLVQLLFWLLAYLLELFAVS